MKCFSLEQQAQAGEACNATRAYSTASTTAKHHMITTIWQKGAKKRCGGWGPRPPNDLFSPAQPVFVSHLVGARRGLRYCLVILRHVLLLMLH